MIYFRACHIDVFPDDGFVADADPKAPPPVLFANEAKPPALLLLATAPNVVEVVFWNEPNPKEGPDALEACPNTDGAAPSPEDCPNAEDCPKPGDAADALSV